MAAAWFGLEADAAKQAASPEAPPSTARCILSLQLQAPDLAAQARFYSDVMGLRVESDAKSVRVHAGGTRMHLTQAPAGQQPVYHVAWAIPAYLLPEAKAWLAGYP
ncbi:MAG: VOC family protein [Acidobacteriota bacterium]